MRFKLRFLFVYGNYMNVLLNDKEYFLQIESFKLVFENLSVEIFVVCVCGLIDCGNLLILDGVDVYWNIFGDDWFVFWVEGVQFLVMNISYYKDVNVDMEGFKID